MFRKNDSYRQLNLFSYENRLTKKQKKLWANSFENKFFESVFQQIDENSFKDLYSNKKSRPNVPVNQLIGALILKHLYNWTYNELFKHLTFNILTRHAIGINSLEIDIFSEASLFNFQNRVIKYFNCTGIDLIERVFDTLTAQQIKELSIDTSIQRGDSFLVGSNIFDYTRLQLLIEIIHRLFKILEIKDIQKLEDSYMPYTNQSSSQYIYRVKKDELPKEMNQLAILYYKTYTIIGEKYISKKEYQQFKRVFEEHFRISNTEQIEVIQSEQLNSSILMSPDDDEATFRKKGKQNSKGYSTHISETANPQNEINLITDVVVEPNNTDDAQILEKRLPKMKETTPELKEYFTDALYGNPKVDEFMSENTITQYQSNVRGKKSVADVKIEQRDEKVIVSCAGGQFEEAKLTPGKNWKVKFDYEKCKACGLLQSCKLNLMGGKKDPKYKVKYFKPELILAHHRIYNIDTLPKEKRSIRANVEASVKEMKRGMKNEKLRVRTRIRVSLHMIFTAIAINLTRICKLSIDFERIFYFYRLQTLTVH